MNFNHTIVHTLKIVLCLNLVLMLLHGSATAEVIDCAHSPGKGNWVYRIIDGQRCWFPANGLHRGKEKPRDELRWAPTTQAEPPKELEERDRGWTHKE
jgi:hypothetical protein